MKLRIRGNSLRLRVTRGEVDALAAGNTVEERLEFPGDAALTYRLRVGEDAERFDASFADGLVTVALPAGAAARWFAPSEVGVRGELPLGPGRSLSLLVEKDFPCPVERAGEDDSDTFPRPGGGEPPRC